MRPGGMGEVVAAADPDLEAAVAGRREDFIGAPAAFLGVAEEVVYRRPGQIEGAAGIEPLRIERRNRPGGGADLRNARARDGELKT